MDYQKIAKTIILEYANGFLLSSNLALPSALIKLDRPLHRQTKRKVRKVLSTEDVGLEPKKTTVKSTGLFQFILSTTAT